MMTHNQTISILAACLFTVAAAAQPFDLTDTGAAAPDFREQFLASYGVNPKIEPEVTQEDRPLYERIEPYLKNNPREAIRIVNGELGPETNAAFYFLLGNLYYQTGQYPQSERALEQAVSKFPSFRRAYRTLGLIYIQSDRFEPAIKAWLKVITLGGGDAQSYGLLAYAYLAEGKYRSALTAYQKALMFKPDSTDFRRGEAQCLLQTAQYQQAAALFDELITEKPDVADYWPLQANAYLELERYDDAMANLEILAGRGQASLESQLLLGNLYLRDDNHRLALVTYQDALKVHGVAAVEDALRPLEYLINRSLFDEAAEYLTTLKSELPAELEAEDRTRLIVAEAGIALESGDRAKAIEQLKPVVKAQPLAAEALLLLAEAYQREEDFEEAEFYLQRVLSIPEEKVEALVALGRLEVRRGDFDAALKHLRAAREQAPRRPGLASYIESIENAR
ncbi:hypothetical protein DDZ13_01350 [Coraliomargarita sinensis]|uniref:Uncharacterized protein n=1 Tax=Coraliomargarita sinensis TaxID=2174842 RepID=A0A317ZIY3_9BACT|nr:tetratricopeptide repeat protein [Coraliomargarita sinensis]PXA05546.1 hypothetical protein DDZ13_01350 [Coraliomargarita sinensis]